MKLGIEMYVSLIVLVVLAFVGISFITINIDVVNARDAQASYVAEIENSNLSESIIQKCKNNAQTHGYELIVDVTNVGSKPTAKVTLCYKYSMAILGTSQKHTIVSYTN